MHDPGKSAKLKALDALISAMMKREASMKAPEEEGEELPLEEMVDVIEPDMEEPTDEKVAEVLDEDEAEKRDFMRRGTKLKPKGRATKAMMITAEVSRPKGMSSLRKKLG